MKEVYYVSIAIGKEREYGAIMPYDPKKDAFELKEFEKRRDLGLIDFLYQGNNLKEAQNILKNRKPISKLISVVI